MEGATATDTDFHCPLGTLSIMVSMLWLMTSMPQGLFTCMVPRNMALMTFLGSSIGVGKDSGTGMVFVCSFEELKFPPRLVGLILRLPLTALEDPLKDLEDVDELLDEDDIEEVL